MKILLLGELSGFHANLKKGLTTLGYEANIAGYTEGWKQMAVDFNLDSNYLYPFNKIHRILKPVFNSKIFNNNDVVQFISPLLFQPFFNDILNKYIIYNNEKSFLTGVSSSDPIYHFGLKNMDYTPFDEYDENKRERFFPNFSNLDIKTHNNLLKSIDGYIPSCYDYYLGYELLHFNKLRKIIPYPIFLDDFDYIDFPPISRKLKLFHGVSRDNFKGSKYIIDAMKLIARKYPNDVSIEIVERLPYFDYINRINNSHVVLDQCRSYSYAMNALISMAKGKITMSGAEPIAIKTMELGEVPVINIKPDSNQIYNELISVLEKRDKLQEISIASRLFVEKNHDAKKIAMMYLEEWLK